MTAPSAPAATFPEPLRTELALAVRGLYPTLFPRAREVDVETALRLLERAHSKSRTTD